MILKVNQKDSEHNHSKIQQFNPKQLLKLLKLKRNIDYFKMVEKFKVKYYNIIILIYFYTQKIKVGDFLWSFYVLIYHSAKNH